MNLAHVLLVLLAILPFDINDIAKINALKEQAAAAFQSKDYQSAALHYSMLLDSMQVEDNRALLNLGHAYYQLKDSANAQNTYQQLTLASQKELKSIAYQQLGMLSSGPQNLNNALQYFKQAIKSDPTNEEARYNYELVKKKLQEQQQQNKDQDQQDQDQEKNEENQDKQEQQKDNQQDKDQQQNQDEQKQDQENQEQKDQQQQENQKEQQQQENQKDQQNQDQEQQQDQQQQQDEQQGEEQKEQPETGEEDEAKPNEEEMNQMPTPSDKLKEMNLSEEKAKMILEAMRNAEIQYIQQMRKKPTKKADSKKPDW